MRSARCAHRTALEQELPYLDPTDDEAGDYVSRLVGLLAWIVEKYREWSDCDGELSRTFTDDFILTQASLYWFTNSISTSFRPYYEYARHHTRRVRHVAVPTAVAVFPKDLVQPPRSWAQRTYNVTRYTRMPRGGHFAAHEQPELLAEDLTAFFWSLR
jgi:pimeloyl-ACP methyl ester carboxylesterase